MDLRLDQLNRGGHGDAAVYLLGALDESARASFEAHAANCAECRREVALLQPIADRLALAVPQVEPPPHLAASIIAAALPAPATITPVPPAQPHPTWWQRVERYSSAISIVALVLALAGSGYAFSQHQEVQSTNDKAAQLVEILSTMYQPGMTPRTLNAAEGAPQAKGRIFLAPDRTQAVLMTYDLPRLPGTQAYQLWLNNPDAGKRDSGGVFQVDESGRGHLLVRAPQVLAEYRNTGVTQEPAKGSQWPTGKRVLMGEL